FSFADSSFGRPAALEGKQEPDPRKEREAARNQPFRLPYRRKVVGLRHRKASSFFAVFAPCPIQVQGDYFYHVLRIPYILSSVSGGRPERVALIISCGEIESHLITAVSEIRPK